MEFPKPRDANSLDATILFDKGCYTSELDRLTKECLEVLMREENRKHVQKLRRKFKPLSGDPYITKDFHFHKEELTEKARELAKDILEKERKNLAESREEGIHNMLEGTYSLMRNWLCKFDEEGNIVMLKFPLTPEDERKHGITHMDKQSMSGMCGRWLAVQKYMPYLSKETQKLNEKIKELTGW